MKKKLLRSLPKVDILLKDKDLQNIKESIEHCTFLWCIKEVLENFRENIKNSTDKDLEKLSDNLLENIKKSIIELIQKKKRERIQKVFNGTGTIIHTNLGRSVFSKKIAKNISDILSSYTNLEYNTERGERGSRYENLEKLICKVTQCEGALVVNNNAGAVLLTLNEFSYGKNAIISRGELVEIGGSFRVPEIIKFSGAKLLEVGTTNRTHLEDYENAINENSGVLLKVHTSNYKIKGFTKDVPLVDLVELSKKKNLLVIEDLGSGNLIEFTKYGVIQEPTIKKSLECGADLVMFSGDKLLGGCQAGIIVGKKHLIDRLKKNQFLRIIRVDKITIAILENIFRTYLNEKEAVKNIPTLRMITENIKEVEKRACKLSKLLNNKNISHNIIPTKATIGGGSMPEEEIDSFGIEFMSNISPNKLEEYFRKNPTSIIGRIEKNHFFIDMKTIFDDDIEELSENIERIFLERGIKWKI